MVHGNEDTSGFQELNLLMLGDQKLRSNSPSRVMFPPNVFQPTSTGGFRRVRHEKTKKKKGGGKVSKGVGAGPRGRPDRANMAQCSKNRKDSVD